MTLLRLLLIEDSENDAKLLLRALERQGLTVESRRVETKDQLDASMAAGHWDLVISDYQLPHFDGLEALRHIRSLDPDIPFIMVSGKVGEELAVTTMRAGANDFMLKDQLARLGPAIEREVRETETRRAQRAYEEERRHLQMAISQSPDAVVITDPKGAIIYANPALESISGYSLAELMGQNPRIFKSGRQDAAFYQQVWDALMRRQIWRGRFVNKRKDDQFWEAEASIAPVVDKAGYLVSYVCTQRDVSRERLLQTQLEQSQRLEAIGLLAAGLAHDFNNILMPILCHSEMGLISDDLYPALRKHFEVIRLSAERAGALTKQVLSFSRNQVTATRNIELHHLVSESLKLLRAAIPSTIPFQVSLDPSSGWVAADATQLHQIVLNLCSNAAHAMRGGAGLLKVSLRKERLPATACALGLRLQEGEYLILEVSDTGHGMSADTLCRIFLPFFTTKAPGEGTGIGLSLVLGIVQGIGGGIQVESELGVGSTFRIFLPSVNAGPPRPEADRRVLPRGTERVLLVDDDITVLSTLEIMLSNLGYRVVAFPHPQEALDRFQVDPEAFDLLLVDLTMPGMTGLALIKKLRSLRPGLHTLVMTGLMEQEKMYQDPSVRPDGTLNKPFSIQAAAELIRKTLGD
jgi:PAS domain S-box-containing protein